VAASSDPPKDPEPGQVVDPEVLAARRARRAEQSEDGSPEPPERRAATLERRLAEAEERLAGAELEARGLAAELDDARHELTAVRQREFAEQRLRIELEDEAATTVRALEEHVAQLEAQGRAAERRAGELVRALERARAEAEEARERALAEQQAAADERLRDELAELRALTETLHGALVAERAAREEAERTLVGERARGRETVAALRRDLERRTAVHGAITGQLAELRTALDAVQARAGGRGAEHAATAAALVEARADAERLRAAIPALEDEAARSRARLERTRDQLADRQAELTGLAQRLAAREEELHELRAETAEHRAARRRAESQLAATAERAAALERDLGGEREARRAAAGGGDRSAAVEALVADLVATTRGLRAGFEQELQALAVRHDEHLHAERRALAVALAAAEERVAAAQGPLDAAARELRERLEQERAAHRAARAELEREAGARAQAERRADAAVAALARQMGRARPGDANPVYGTVSAGPLVPPADHPALARAAPPAPQPDSAPPVVDALTRAMERLRATPGPAAGAVTPAPVAPTPAPATLGLSPVPPEPPLRDLLPPPPSRRAQPPATTHPWFGEALAAFADIDAPTAERLLLAALPVQALRVGKDVTYALELPATGRHDVRITAGGGAAVAPAAHPSRPEFVLAGPVGALAPLAAGGAPRLLAGVSVSGRRRRLRRLLRALREPIGLPELRRAGAYPRPGDLLALLCSQVPAGEVRGADFGVAYVVAAGAGRPTRVLVRAEPTGALTAIPEAPASSRADATLTVAAGELLDVLDGAASVTPEGDPAAVLTLHRWLRGVQGL
jgi:chromosome segregation ATPase